MGSARMLLLLVSAIIAGRLAHELQYINTCMLPYTATLSGGFLQSCVPFGKNVTATSGSSIVGFFANNNSAAACAGVATVWNYCYYTASQLAPMPQ